MTEILCNDSPAYIPSGIDMELFSKFLKDEKRLVRVLAHPAAGSYPGESHYKEVLPPFQIVQKLLPEFLDENRVNIDGLEVYYPGHTDEQKQWLAQLAEKRGLLVTGGSDFHDPTLRPLGAGGMTREETEKFLEYMRSK